MTATATPTQTSAAPVHAPGRRRTGIVRYLIIAGLVLLAIIMLFPFAIVAINAVKTPADYATSGPLALPSEISFQGLIDFWNRANFGRKLLNSLIISGSVAVIAVILSLLNSFALGVGRIKGRIWILVLFLIANTIPHEALVYPLYYASLQVGLYDTQLAVIIIFAVIQCAFGTYLLSSVLSTFPRELLDAAALDGATKWQILWRIVAPMSRPTLGVLFTFFFIWTWNEFFLPLIFLISNDKQTVPVALAVLQGDRLMDATTTSASALLGILPAVIFFLIFQRTLTRGIAAGAVK
jgi:raffinose/stachyose/melibiose transport system permease protein